MTTKIPYTLLSDGVAGELLTWNASGLMSAVAAGSNGQVLTSNGAGAAPTFQNIVLGGAGGGFDLQVYKDTVDFTAGVTSTLSLPDTPSGEDNVFVYFDGLWQESDTWSLAGSDINFSSAIPAGTTTVAVRIFLPGTLPVTVVETNVANEFTKQQNFNATTLVDAASIAWNLDDNQVTSVTLGGNRTLANPTNMVDGATYILRVIQDGTGSRTLTFGSAYKFPGGTAPTLTTTPNAVDILTFISDGTNMYGVFQGDFS